MVSVDTQAKEVLCKLSDHHIKVVVDRFYVRMRPIKAIF